MRIAVEDRLACDGRSVAACRVEDPTIKENRANVSPSHLADVRGKEADLYAQPGRRMPDVGIYPTSIAVPLESGGPVCSPRSRLIGGTNGHARSLVVHVDVPPQEAPYLRQRCRMINEPAKHTIGPKWLSYHKSSAVHKDFGPSGQDAGRDSSLDPVDQCLDTPVVDCSSPRDQTVKGSRDSTCECHRKGVGDQKVALIFERSPLVVGESVRQAGTVQRARDSTNSGNKCRG